MVAIDNEIKFKSIFIAEPQERRTFRKFQFRGIELDAILELPQAKVIEMFTSRIKRRFSRGMGRQYTSLVNKNYKKDCKEEEKPACVNTHLRNMIVLPEMIGGVVGVYNGKTFTKIEIKAGMIGHYLGEFSMTYKPVKHGKAGLGATKSSRFIPLK